MSGCHGPFVADDDEARGLMSLVTGRELPAEQAGEETVMGPYMRDEEASLLAARDAFAGKWDIIEVFGGYLAVPDGTPVIQSSTIGGLTAKLRKLP